MLRLSSIQAVFWHEFAAHGEVNDRRMGAEEWKPAKPFGCQPTRRAESWPLRQVTSESLRL